MKEGVAFYFQYFIPAQGKEVKRSLPLGEYDETGKRGLSLPQARDRAANLARLYRDGVTDLHGHFERQRESVERSRAAEEEAARRAAEEAKNCTLAGYSRCTWGTWRDTENSRRRMSAASSRSTYSRPLLMSVNEGPRT
jgi:hypothetical protein